MCAHKSLLLALVLNLSSHASYSKRDVNMISLKGLIKAIFLFKGAKGVFLAINYIKNDFTAFGY